MDESYICSFFDKDQIVVYVKLCNFVIVESINPFLHNRRRFGLDPVSNAMR